MGNPRHDIGSGVDDAQMGRIVAVGTIIGIPLVFVVSTLLALRVGVMNAMAIAVLPTLFSGSFVGGLILLTGALRRAERATMPAGPVVIVVPNGARGRPVLNPQGRID